MRTIQSIFASTALLWSFFGTMSAYAQHPTSEAEILFDGTQSSYVVTLNLPSYTTRVCRGVLEPSCERIANGHADFRVGVDFSLVGAKLSLPISVIIRANEIQDERAQLFVSVKTIQGVVVLKETPDEELRELPADKAAHIRLSVVNSPL